MIIDFHVHSFPDKVVKKAMNKLEKNSAIVPCNDGTISGILEHAKQSGVDYVVIHNIATSESQQKNANDYAIEINKLDKVIGFGSVYPYASNVFEELQRIKDAGLRGIKLHPDYQEFYVDDERVFPIYEMAAKLGLITLFHAGLDIGLFDPVHCTPERLAKALPVFGGAPVVAAHFGGFQMWYDVEKYLVGKDIYFDTSYCYSKMPYMHARRIMENHGSDKLLFGSDSPWSDMSREIIFVKAFAESESDKILGINAQKLLKL